MASQTDSSQSPGTSSPTLKYDWTKLANAPNKICLANAVLGKEKEVYVGGFEAEHRVHLYSLEENHWQILPKSPVIFFGMTYFEGKLLTVGGVNDNNDVVSTVYQFNKEAQRWDESTTIPPMPTARSTPTLVARHGSSPAIAACGGLSQLSGTAQVVSGSCQLPKHDSMGRGPCDIVEVYSGGPTWSIGVAMPYPLFWTTPVLIGDTCYFMGGRNHSVQGSKWCFFASLNSLMESTIDAATEQVWQNLPDTPLRWSATAKLGEKLVAIGGRDDNCSSAAIHVLEPTDGGSYVWERLRDTDLPETCERAIAINLTSHELMIIGGAFYCKENSVPGAQSNECKEKNTPDAQSDDTNGRKKHVYLVKAHNR